MSASDQGLVNIREQIDAIDQQIQDLLNQRAACALEVARIKQNSTDKAIYRPEREAQILRNIIQRNPGPLPSEDVAAIFNLILAKSRQLQQPLEIACLAPKTGLSHTAAIKQFGPNVKITHQRSIEQIFRLVANRQVNYGIIPIENSKTGIVNETLDCLLKQALQICAEIILPTPKDDSNTRFAVVGLQSPPPSGVDKTSLLISTTNKPGSLAKIFQPFAKYGVNISAITSRPSAQQLWSYLFLLILRAISKNMQYNKPLKN
ncbi:MAG: chorismate mutase [Coxiellaceae bacterium]|nr:MAG: chorismate mutase [Coxiellaceae bacterium]